MKSRTISYIILITILFTINIVVLVILYGWFETFESGHCIAEPFASGNNDPKNPMAIENISCKKSHLAPAVEYEYHIYYSPTAKIELFEKGTHTQCILRDHILDKNNKIVVNNFTCQDNTNIIIGGPSVADIGDKYPGTVPNLFEYEIKFKTLRPAFVSSAGTHRTYVVFEKARSTEIRYIKFKIFDGRLDVTSITYSKKI